VHSCLTLVYKQASLCGAQVNMVTVLDKLVALFLTGVDNID